MAVKPIPDGYHSVTPYLVMRDAAKAIEFYKETFGAVELFRMPGADGKIAHAEIRIGNSVVMLGEENPKMGAEGPELLGGSAVGLMVYVDHCDAVFARAIAAGAAELRPLTDQFYGDRSGTITDPFGHQWTIATHVEDVPPDEMEKRAASYKQQQ